MPVRMCVASASVGTRGRADKFSAKLSLARIDVSQPSLVNETGLTGQAALPCISSASFPLSG
jgi:hypothetical protein